VLKLCAAFCCALIAPQSVKKGAATANLPSLNMSVPLLLLPTTRSMSSLASYSCVLIGLRQSRVFPCGSLVRILLGAVDCIAEPNRDLCQEAEVRSFPTLRYYKFGKFQSLYKGGREEQDFINFVNNPSANDEL
jgi:hypothetical protein